MTDKMQQARKYLSYRMLREIVAVWLDRYLKNAGSIVEHPHGAEAQVQIIHQSTFGEDADVLLYSILEGMLIGSPQVEARAAKIFLVLDVCFTIAKKVVYQIIDGNADEFDGVELKWLIGVHADNIDGAKYKRDMAEKWRRFSNRVIVDNMDE